MDLATRVIWRRLTLWMESLGDSKVHRVTKTEFGKASPKVFFIFLFTLFASLVSALQSRNAFRVLLVTVINSICLQPRWACKQQNCVYLPLAQSQYPSSSPSWKNYKLISHLKLKFQRLCWVFDFFSLAEGLINHKSRGVTLQWGRAGRLCQMVQLSTVFWLFYLPFSFCAFWNVVIIKHFGEEILQVKYLLS